MNKFESLSNQLNKTPKVSIGMPVYNGEPFIREALDSLLAQTFTDFELIISDNASTDGTETICREYASNDKRIRYVRQTKNLGPVANFQYVLDEAIGEYFMWAATDDSKSPDFIEKNLSFLENNAEYVASTSPVRFEEEDFNEINMGDFSLDQEKQATRLILFFTQWHANGRFYSLMVKKFLNGLPFKDFLGFDWFVIIFLLKKGKLKRLSEGYQVLGKNGESNTTNVFKKYNRQGIIYFLFPLKDLFENILRLKINMSFKEKIKILIRWLTLSYQALKLNIKFTLFKR